ASTGVASALASAFFGAGDGDGCCAFAAPSDSPSASAIPATKRGNFVSLFFIVNTPTPSLNARAMAPFLLTEEDWTRMRPVNLHVTGRAVRVLGILVMLWTTRFNRSHVMRH